MRRSLSAAAFALIALLFSCEAEGPASLADDIAPPALGLVSEIGETCGGTAFPLIADETVAVGTVEVWNDESTLWIVYRTDAAWPIGKTAVTVGDSPDAIPTNGPGNPQVGRFHHQARHAGLHEIIWEIELGTLTGEVVVAAFAEVGADAEGAWAGGEDARPIRDGGSWATYVVHALAVCSVEEEVGTEGGTIVFQDVTFQVPAGSLSEPEVLTVEPTTLGLQNEIKFYEFGPSGTTFDPPAELVIDYDENGLPPGVAESRLRGAIGNGIFELAPDAVVDPDANTVTIPVEHFSAYGVVYVDDADLRVQFPLLSEDPPRVGVPVTYSASFFAAPGSPTVAGATATFELTGDADLVSMPGGCSDFSGVAIPDVAVACTLTLEAGLLVPLEFEVVASSADAPLEAVFEVAPPLNFEDPDLTNNSLEVSTTSVGLFADLAIASSAPPVAVVGETFPWTTTVTTVSHNVDAVDVIVTPQLIASAATLTLPAECGVFTCALPDADPDVSHVAVMDVTPTAAGELTLNAAAAVSILEPATDPVAANNSATSTVQAYLEVADVSVSLSDSPDPVQVGGTVTYTAHLANAADALSEASLAEFVFTVDGPGSPTPSSAPAGCTDVSAAHAAAIAFECAIPTIAPGDAADLDFVVSPGTDGTLTAFAELGIPGGVLDPDQTNNTALETTQVASPATDVDLVLSAGGPQVTDAGVPSQYVVSVLNPSTQLSTGVIVEVFSSDSNVQLFDGQIPPGCTDQSDPTNPVFLLCALPDIMPGTVLDPAVAVFLVFDSLALSADLFFSILAADQQDPNLFNNEAVLEVQVSP